MDNLIIVEISERNLRKEAHLVGRTALYILPASTEIEPPVFLCEQGPAYAIRTFLVHALPTSDTLTLEKFPIKKMFKLDEIFFLCLLVEVFDVGLTIRLKETPGIL